MKSDFANEFKARTKAFALRCLNLLKSLPKDPASQIIGKQLFRASSSIASNYRAVCRSRSDAEFYAKLSIVVEEADEAVFWIEMLIEGNILPKNKLESLYKESIEILSIVSSSRKTFKSSKIKNLKISE